ncbi:hypothetical protein GNP95_15175 [Paenibacillus woosongensis]|uniref:BIG2 domain-containing protein n=1 Tax=Paenibacillus woosongensis TaxID=307580 RepID=A0A7X2Z3V2_9BACL|nr:hypothetical protein [Paenibacillus woosongensis]
MELEYIFQIFHIGGVLQLIKQWYKPFVVSLAFVLLWSGWAGNGYAEMSEEEAIVEWSHLLKGSDPESPRLGGEAVTKTSDGGYVAVGKQGSSLSDGMSAVVLKVSGSGEMVWREEINFLHEKTGFYASNSGLSVLEASDGSILVGGDVRDIDYGRPRYDPFVAKFSPDGELLWKKEYRLLSIYTHSADVIMETSDGNFVITGSVSSNFDRTPGYMIKINGEGEVLWSNTYLIGTWAAFRDIVALPDGSVIVAGRMSSSEISGSLAVIAKINRGGELVWVKRNEHDQIHSMIPSRDGNMILTRYNKGENRYYLQTISSAGTVLSDLTLDSLTGEAIQDLIHTQLHDSGYLFVAKLKTGGSKENSFGYQIIVTDENGRPVQKHFFGEPFLSLGRYGISGYDQGLVVAGSLDSEVGPRMMQLTKIALSSQTPADPELSRIEFQPNQLKLAAGQTAPSVVNAVYKDATVTDVTYSAVYESLDPNIASIDQFGNITGISPGTTRITATYEGMQASMSVEVTGEQPGPGYFFLDSDEYSLSVGTELDVAAYFTDESGLTSLVTKETVFTVDDPNIVSLDEAGNIRGISPGITYITAVYNGMTYRASVWVVRPYQAI